MKGILILAVLLLAGCGTTYEVRVAGDVAKLDPASAEVCEPVPTSPVKGKASMGELYTFSDKMIALYGECALRDRGKLRWIKSQGH
jgi:hypothetical protein